MTTPVFDDGFIDEDEDLQLLGQSSSVHNHSYGPSGGGGANELLDFTNRGGAGAGAAGGASSSSSM